jgi:hypothetical protein
VAFKPSGVISKPSGVLSKPSLGSVPHAGLKLLQWS